MKAKHFLPFITSFAFIAGARADDYHVNSEGNLIQVTSPYGTKMYFGDVGFGELPSYRVEIPIRDLRDSTGGSAGKGGGAGTANGGDGTPGSPRDVESEDDLILEANSLYQKARFAESLKYVEELNRRNPTNVRGWVMRGSLLHALGQPEMARKAWEHALSLDPSNLGLKKILDNGAPTVPNKTAAAPNGDKP